MSLTEESIAKGETLMSCMKWRVRRCLFQRCRRVAHTGYGSRGETGKRSVGVLVRCLGPWPSCSEAASLRRPGDHTARLRLGDTYAELDI
jgi:hypothetical protein